jgi:hypothetical protein
MPRHRSVTDQSGLSAQPATGEGQAVRAGYHPTEDGVEANRQRRMIQNRKNQRAHRLRTKEQDLSTTVRKPRPFQVTRWRLDSPDDLSDTNGTAITPSTSNRPLGIHNTALASRVPVKATGQSQSRTQANLTPPSIIFPLSTDHLLHRPPPPPRPIQRLPSLRLQQANPEPPPHRLDRGGPRPISIFNFMSHQRPLPRRHKRLSTEPQHTVRSRPDTLPANPPAPHLDQFDSFPTHSR